jgi:hypothetical protein
MWPEPDRVSDVGMQDDLMDARRRGNQTSVSATCAQCGNCGSGHWLGWRAYRSDTPALHEPPALAFFCRDCAQREFGS